MHHVNKIKKRLSLLYFAVLGLLVYLPLAPFLVVLAILSLPFPKLMNLYYFIMLKGIHLYIKLSPVKYAQKDLNTLTQIDQRKCVIIANHRSHLDMYLFLSEVYKVRAVASSYLLKVPIIGQVLWMSGHFVMETGNIKAYKRALAQILVAFERKDKVLFFPELHRCEPGFAGIHKFHLTAFQMARENNVEIIPVVISGTDEIWPRDQLTADFSKKISMKALKPIQPNSFNDSATLAKYVHDLMSSELKAMAR